jgi:hypothetical protein
VVGGSSAVVVVVVGGSSVVVVVVVGGSSAVVVVVVGGSSAVVVVVVVGGDAPVRSLSCGQLTVLQFWPAAASGQRSLSVVTFILDSKCMYFLYLIKYTHDYPQPPVLFDLELV